MSIRLSLCIATLNRAHFIGATLESIISQATDEVEVVVVDGASTDNTAQVVQQYQEKFPRLLYVRLEAKGGVDRDYDRAVAMAQGEYCWLMTDDDLLKPGAIQAVLFAMQTDYKVIVVNAEVYNADLSQRLISHQLPFRTDRVYQPTAQDRERFLVEVGFYLTFIGSLVIQRELWNRRDRESYFGTEFVHLGVIFADPMPVAARVLSEPWIMIRYGNAQWAPRSFGIWMFKLPSLIWSLPGYTTTARRQVCPKEPWRKISALLLFRARGAYGLDEYQQWIMPRSGTLAGKLIAHTIARLPGCVVNGLAWVYAYARQRRLLLIDLINSPFYFRRCRTQPFSQITERSRAK